MTSLLQTSLLLAALASSVTWVSGCGFGGCGVAPVQTNGGAATVVQDGTVVFDAIAVGSSETFAMPIKESADTDETIVSARVNGAFKVLTPMPIYVPRGGTVTVDVSFSPDAVGETKADLVLETAKMGSSHVALAGTGI